jgi:hypothetical protein
MSVSAALDRILLNSSPNSVSNPTGVNRRCSGMVELLESQAIVQMRAERDTSDVSSLCSFRKASAARSPMMMQGAIVFAGRHARHDRAICDAKVLDSIDPKLGIYDRHPIAPHFCGTSLMPVRSGRIANKVF